MEYLAIGLIGLMSALNFAVMIKLSMHKVVLICRKRQMQKKLKQEMGKKLEYKIDQLKEENEKIQKKLETILENNE